jgi:hypothetical protein
MLWRYLIFALGALILPMGAGLHADELPNWSKANGQRGTTYTHTSNAAMILVAQIPPEKAQDPSTAVNSMDRPGACEGISKSKYEPAFEGRGRRIKSRSAAAACTMLFAKVGNQNIMVFALEQAGANAGAEAVAEALMRSEMRTAPNSAAPAIPVRVASAVVPAPVTRPVGGLARARAPVGLVGMWRSDWVENQYRAFTGLTLVALNNTLIFTTGGYFFNGVPENVALDDAGALEMIGKDPENAGRYGYAGGVITLSYANGNKETVAAKKAGQEWQLIFRNRPMSPKMTFMSGGFLSGNYATQRITNAGGAYVVGEDDYSFAPDGRFAKGGSVSLSSAAVSSVGARGVRSGRYVIKSSALYLRYDDGTQEVYSMFQETAGKEIWLNDQMYSPY